MKRVVAAFMAVVLSAAVAQAENLGKIMPMGDSITYGVGSENTAGYRELLYTLLKNRGDTFTFVGPHSGYATETLTQAGSQYHAGISGIAITNFNNCATATSQRSGLHENLKNWIGPGKETPDAILLMIGTNDIDQNFEPENAPKRLDAFISSIYDYCPNVKLFLATIVPMKNARNPNVIACNAAFPQLVAEHRAKGHDVRLVPMYDALDTATDFADTLHPNRSGYQKMAQTWDTALHAHRYAADLLISSNGSSLDYSVGWDFTVTKPIIVKALGQFDPNKNPTDNQVALYRRAGEKIIEVTVKADAVTAANGTRTARYAPVQDILLTNGNYVIFSQQNGVNYLDNDNAASFGEGIVWNKGVAISGKNATLPDSAPTTKWQIENPNQNRYFGPTFQYELAPPLMAEVLSPASGASFSSEDMVAASVKVTQGTAPYTVQFYLRDATGATKTIGSAQTGDGPTFSTEFNVPKVGTYQVYATVEDSSDPKATAVTDFRTFIISYQHAIDIEKTTGGNIHFNVGWRFEVNEPIWVTELGQFDGDGNVQSNVVALYKNRGDMIIKTSIPTNAQTELSGYYKSRYMPIERVFLSRGTYEILSMQNGKNFISTAEKDKVQTGSAITWLIGIAQGSDFEDDEKTILRELPASTANLLKNYDNNNNACYFGPTFKYEKATREEGFSFEITSPANDATVGSSPFVNLSVQNVLGAYVVDVYVSSDNETFVKATCTTNDSNVCSVKINALTVGKHYFYVTLTDSFSTVHSATNSFNVVPVGQHPLELTGWNHDLILGADEEVTGGYTKAFSGWTFYEYGYPGSQHGLAASAAPTNRTFTSAYKSSTYNQTVAFTFQPYTENNVLFVSTVNEEQTLTLTHPTQFYALQFLLTTRTANWFARLNFSDGSSVDTPTYEDVDWISGGTPDIGLSNYGLRKTADGQFYTTYIWMADRHFSLPEQYRKKTLTSITFKVVGGTSHELCVLAVSGYGLEPADDVPLHAFDLISADPGYGPANNFVLGWDFTVLTPITITELGQYSFNNGALGNSVALYKIGGAKLQQVHLAAGSTLEKNGNEWVRYQKIPNLHLEPGDYRIASTQTNNQFRAQNGTITGTSGVGIKWIRGIAEWSKEKLGLPEDGGDSGRWSIKNAEVADCYKGPTFKYFLGRIWPKSTFLFFR